MQPHSIVAVVLSASVLAFILGAVSKGLMYPMLITPESLNVWADLMKVIVGGLIGYMATGNTK